MSNTLSGQPMIQAICGIFSDRSCHIRGRVAGLYALLIGGNLASWIWALVTFRPHPVLLGTALLAYGLGLRHAVDADHIAAIDNVTRKLMQEGKRPTTVGLFFSLGHSTIVLLTSVGLAATTAVFNAEFRAFEAVSGAIGTLISASFLLAIAGMNIVVLAAVCRTFARVRRGAPYVEEDTNVLLGGRGLLARFFRPVFALISQSWHMYPLGVLFGLGFDTATEIGLLGISATQAAQGMSIWSVLVFPALFTAGMSLVDTTDGILMLEAYGWAFTKPLRKIYYNMVITFGSILVAILIGGIEVIGLVSDQFGLKGGFWDSIGTLNGSFGTIGYLIVVIFAFAWITSMVIYHACGYDRIELK